MSEQAESKARPASGFGRALHSTANALAIFGGVLSCIMAALVTISVAGRYTIAAPIPGDYDLVGILCGCAIFAFLPYCQLHRGNVIADFFTQGAPARVKAGFDAGGNVIFLLAMAMFTWRLYFGMLELRQSSEQIAAFAFYRWWTIPFDLFCMIVLLCAIFYTLQEDLSGIRAGKAAEHPIAKAE